MRLVTLSLSLLSAILLPAVAHAAPLPETVYFNNTVLNNGANNGASSIATVTGSIDYVTNYVTANNFAVSIAGTTYSFVSTATTYPFSPAPRDNAAEFYFTGTTGTSTYYFDLVLPVFSGNFNIDGTTLCPLPANCRVLQSIATTRFGLSQTNVYSVATGTLSATPPAPTPEPSTLTLLAPASPQS